MGMIITSGQPGNPSDMRVETDKSAQRAINVPRGTGFSLAKTSGVLGAALGKAGVSGGGPGATLSLAEYRALFGRTTAPPPPRLAPARLTPTRRRRREEEILLLCDFA